MIAYILGAVGLFLAYLCGYLTALYRLTRRVEAMHAAMVATSPGPYRRQLADRHLAAWRRPIRHLLHRRAAA